MTSFFVLPLITAPVSALLTMLARWAALRWRVIDAPGDARRLHRESTPRGGGAGIALLLLLALLIWPLEGAKTSGALVSGVFVIILAGLIDDLRPLPAVAKLAGQVIGAGLIGLALPWGGQVTTAGVLASVLLVLVLVNVWNFMDGSNGMAAVQGLLASAGIGWVTSSPWAVALAGACLGFLPFNLPTARIFLGDVGSHALGAGLAVILLQGLAQGMGPALPLLLCSAFLLDAGWTLLRRLHRRERFWEAHSQHLYQQRIRAGRSHARVCAEYAAWTMAAGLLGLWAMRHPLALQWALVFTLYAGGSLLYFAAMPKDQGCAKEKGL